METGDSSSSPRQDNGRNVPKPHETLHPGDGAVERATEGGPKCEDDPTNSGVRMDLSRKEIAARPSAMNAPATGGSSVDGIPCKECGVSFTSLQAYMEHRCPNARRALPRDGIESEVSDLEDSDVETLEGEIVYQPNGSAFIIEDSGESTRNSPGAHALFSSAGLPNRQTSVPLFPQVISTFHIASSLGRQLAVDQTSPNTSSLAGIGPVLHSFRVYDLRHKGDEDCPTGDGGSKNSRVSKDALNGLDLSRFDGCVKDGKSKPVLMCFLCRMSFGYVRSFVNHAIHDHQMALNQEEQKVLANKYVSAIIQGIGQDREPLISFLEPKKPLSLLPLFSAADHIGPDPSLHSLWGALHNMDNASLQAGFASLKGSVSSASLEEVSVMPKAEMNLGTPSLSANALPQDCSLSGTAGKSQESSGARKRGGSSRSPFSHMEGSIKSEPQELAEEEENGEAYSSESEDEADIGIGEPVDFAAGRGLPFSNQSIPHLPSPSLKCDVKWTPSFAVTVAANAEMAKQVAAPRDRSSDVDGNDRSEKDYMKGQEETKPLSLDDQRREEEVSPAPPHQHVSGKPGTPDTPSTGRGTPNSDTESPKRDTVLGLSRSPRDYTAAMQSGIPCKTLKCPMCNWHYKYQQSLDAHVKEKHPEMDTSCIYCGTGQPHPRLSRGESHNCGYKPFHCEVCNYSTTTKGNLTIHMQSDRHLTNVQMLQTGGVEMSDGRLARSTPVSMDGGAMPSPTKSKQKSSWRCEACDYETSVARNLRIHMTSEKHVHNVMLLQQTYKQIRAGLQPGLAPAEAQLYQYYLAQNMGLAGLKLENPAEQHLMVSPFQFSPFTAAGLIPGLVNDDLAKELHLASGQQMRDDQPLLSAGELSPCVSDPPQRLYQCGVCNRFASDSLEALSAHVSEERTLPLEDWRAIAGDLYQCRLCGYTTQLRANFLLHCQTDRHLHRYQLAAHLKESGEPNRWRLKDVANGNPVHLKCNACDYHSNSVEKLRRHTANQRHEAALKLYKWAADRWKSMSHFLRGRGERQKHLQKQESALNSESCYFYCALCDYSTKAKLHLVQHLHSARHQQALGSRKLQLLQLGLGPEADNLADLFFVKDRPTRETAGEGG
ncbi:hypothetical protein AAFF_G00291780 [Aldrovandia affinis]|uniref:C2H2-type domain-containing protein n=1 Tax=Aldrovandia affinis TaxID=143900 RepID=A0AAD7WRT4_9TELE|nr:hypothetical protein AAFF_G00291780 [Aldrovandia affinis]